MERTAGSFGSLTLDEIPPSIRSDALSRQPSLILFSLDDIVKYRIPSVFIASAFAVGAPFWLLWGHDLRYNVYANGTFSYDEQFSTTGRVLVTLLIAVVAGGLVSLVVHVVCRAFRSSPSNDDATV
jgi:hypothetical protein